MVVFGVWGGGGAAGFAMVRGAFVFWVLGMPCSCLVGVARGWGGMGIWAGLVAGLGVAGLLLNARFWGVTIKKLAA